MATFDLSRAKRRAGIGFLWTAPLLLLLQFVGNFPKTPVWTTAFYLLLFLGALWLGSAPESTADELQSPPVWRRGVGVVLVALGAAGLVVGVLRIFGLAGVEQWFQGGGWLAKRPGKVLIPTLAAWPLALGIPLVRERRIDASSFVRLGALVGLPLLALLASGINYQGLQILAASSLATRLFAGAAALALAAAALFPRRRASLLVIALLATGLLLRALGLWTWQIDPAIRDMLALVESAQDAFLAGENPYQVHQMQKGSEVPLTYLPGMWLLYLFPRLLGLDIRWMGLVADAAVVGSLWWVAAGAGTDDETSWPEAVAAGLGAVWLFLPTVHWNGIYAEPHVWWGILALWLASVLRRRWWVAAALTGLAVTTRHFGVVVLPFVLIALLRDLGWRQALPRVALAGGVAAILLIPFVASEPHSFWFGTFQWLQEYGPQHQNWFYNKLGFSGPLYEADLDGWLKWGQLASVVLPAGIYALWPGDSRSPGRLFVGFAGTAYVGFVVFNGIIWSSFYLGTFLFVALALTHATRSDAPEGAVEAVPEKWWRVGAAVFAVSMLAGGWIAYSLVSFHSHSGLTDVQNELSGRLDRDDLLVDRTARELEFVEGGDPLIAGVGSSGPTVADDLFSTQLLASDEPRDVWVAARTSWNREYLERITLLGRVESTKTLGHYTLLHLRVPPVRTRLSKNLGALTPTWRSVQGGSSREYRRSTKKGEPRWSARGLPKWVKVHRKKCEIGSLRERILFAHPHEKASIELAWRDVELGRSMLLYGGVENPAITWNRGAVQVELRIDGKPRKTLRIENRPGPWWTSLDTQRWSGEKHRVTLVVETRDDRQRWTCLEGAVLGTLSGT